MHKLALVLKTLALSALLATSAVAGSERVNINTADAATLDRVLIGIGPAKAEAIVVYRKANGAFRSPDQLASVKGIGLSTIERNRDRILVAGGVAAAAPGRPPTLKPGAAKPVAPRPAGAR
jgi:competence protein ComEA